MKKTYILITLVMVLQSMCCTLMAQSGSGKDPIIDDAIRQTAGTNFLDKNYKMSKSLDKMKFGDSEVFAANPATDKVTLEVINFGRNGNTILMTVSFKDTSTGGMISRTYSWSGPNVHLVPPYDQGIGMLTVMRDAVLCGVVAKDTKGKWMSIVNTSWGGTKIEVWTPEKGDRWNHMVRPMAGYALRGFLWYQGETNLINGDIDAYIPKMERLVSSWRQAWGDEDLPFYYVQISPMTYSQRKDYASPRTWIDLPRFWAAQTECMKRITNTGMVVTTDLPDELSDIHPPYKWKVGERLCLWALHHTYGHTQTECSGPVLESAAIEDGKAVLTFSHADGGLTTSDGKAPDWFYTNKPNGRCYKTGAAIDAINGNRVIVDLQSGVKSHTIRFGYDEVGQPNLRNRAGLPAQPFKIKLKQP